MRSLPTPEEAKGPWTEKHVQELCDATQAASAFEAAAPVDRVELYVERGGEHGWDSAVKPRYACVLVRPEAHAAYVAASGKPLKDNPVRIEVAWPHRR